MEATVSLPNKLIFFPLFLNVAMTFLGYGIVMSFFGITNLTQNIIPNQNYLWIPPMLWYQGCLQTSCSASTLNSITFWFIPVPLYNALVALSHLDLAGFGLGIFQAFTQTDIGLGFFSAIAGAVLLLLAFGIGGSFTVAGSGINISTNPQGSRLAQVFGLCLLLLGFESIVFMNWINLLPPMLGTVVTAIIYICTLTGGYLRAQQID